MEFTELWEKLDHEKIRAAINAQPGLFDHDYEAARACVFHAAQKWLVDDLGMMEITGIEVQNNLPLLEFDSEIKCFLDLKGIIRNSNDIHKTFLPYKGCFVVLDWKSARSQMDVRWKDRLLESWQWRIYAAATGAKLHMYRGIRRSPKPLEPPETRELILEVPETTLAEVQEYARGVIAMRETLVNLDLQVWPRNRPHSCRPFGEDCPFLSDCDNYTMPRKNPGTKVLSYSSMSHFLQCPEYHRRREIAEDKDQGTADTRFGQAVHAGLAEVYSQAFHIPVTER